MKNKSNVPLVRLFGIAAIVAVIGLSMAACEEPPDFEGTREEYKEAATAGRLTITGLSEYNGKEISAGYYYDDGGNSLSNPLHAYQTVHDAYHYYNGKLECISWDGDRVNGTITGDQVTLKVFRQGDDHEGNIGGFPLSYIGAWESYTGNDQNVEFDVVIYNAVYYTEGHYWGNKNGKVTLNFTNGIGSGAFVPN
jgi:hypothetical protein